MQKYDRYETLYEKDQLTNKSFDKSYRKSSQVNISDKNEYESLCNIFSRYVDELLDESSYKPEHKNKITFF